MEGLISEFYCRFLGVRHAFLPKERVTNPILVPGSQIVGKALKKKPREKLAEPENGKRKRESFLPFYLRSGLRFLNSRDPTISETGTG